MGIEFSHGGAAWSYGGFMRARIRLAATIGVDLRQMDGFSPGGKSWATVTDKIVPLLHHSDCDGELTPGECRILAPRLRELVSQWPEDDHDRKLFEALADGMEEAAEDDEPLEFM